MQQTTKDVRLTRGYLDSEGGRHRLVTLRAPTADDEVKADRAMNLLKASRDAGERAEGASDTLWELSMLASCCLRLGEIRQVTSDHLRALSRRDASMLRVALVELEAELEEPDREDKSPNPVSGASTSSDSPARPPSPSATS